jgi:hypothetical protein
VTLVEPEPSAVLPPRFAPIWSVRQLQFHTLDKAKCIVEINYEPFITALPSSRQKLLEHIDAFIKAYNAECRTLREESNASISAVSKVAVLVNCVSAY